LKKDLRVSDPLELQGIRKENRDLWHQIPYQCLVMIERDIEPIRDTVRKYAEALFDLTGIAYAVVWVFGSGIEKDFLEHCKDMNIVFCQGECVIFKLENNTSIERIVDEWGWHDVLDIVFENCGEADNNTKGEDGFLVRNGHKNFRRYHKDFINRVLHSCAIISDSGDGEELQMIISESVLPKITGIAL
jgi:hypothetical protein